MNSSSPAHQPHHDAVLPTLGGNNAFGSGFVWGLPFFYGRNIYFSIAGQSMTFRNAKGPVVGLLNSHRNRGLFKSKVAGKYEAHQSRGRPKLIAIKALSPSAWT